MSPCRQEKQDRWKNAILEHIQTINFSPKFLHPQFNEQSGNITFSYSCNDQASGIVTELEVILEDETVIKKQNITGHCGFGKRYEFSSMGERELGKTINDIYQYKNIMPLIKEATLRIVGTYPNGGSIYINALQKRNISAETYGLEYGSKLDQPIEYKVYRAAKINNLETKKKYPTKFKDIETSRRMRKDRTPASAAFTFSINKEGKPFNLIIHDLWCGDSDKSVCNDYRENVIKEFAKSRFEYDPGDEKELFGLRTWYLSY